MNKKVLMIAAIVVVIAAAAFTMMGGGSKEGAEVAGKVDLNSLTVEQLLAKAKEEGRVDSVGMPDSWANWVQTWTDLKDKYDNDPDILSKVTLEDLRNFGMIPEFLGRLPVICTLSRLTKEMLVRILKEPKNAILKQYQKLLALDEVQLEFDDGALEAIAEKALERDTGARALRAIIEDFMLDIMYEIPKDDNIGRVTITREYIEHTGGPLIAMRGVLKLEDQSAAQG